MHILLYETIGVSSQSSIVHMQARHPNTYLIGNNLREGSSCKKNLAGLYETRKLIDLDVLQCLRDVKIRDYARVSRLTSRITTLHLDLSIVREAHTGAQSKWTLSESGSAALRVTLPHVGSQCSTEKECRGAPYKACLGGLCLPVQGEASRGHCPSSHLGAGDVCVNGLLCVMQAFLRAYAWK